MISIIMKTRSFLFAVGMYFLFSKAYGVCVNVEKANLRYGPGTKYQKTWEVYRYMPFQKLKSQNGWYRVKDVDGDIHWLFEKLGTEKFKCAVVNAEKANLRTGPGTNYPKVAWGPAQKYYSFKILKKKGQWYHVQDAADGKAWVYSPLVWVQ